MFRFLYILLAFVSVGALIPAQAGLIINATFDTSITSQADAASIEGAIDAAIGVLEADISTNVTANIDFQAMSGGLGESNTNIYSVSYYNYYTALKAVDTAPGASAAQLSAFASLGPAPSPGSGNPVNGNTSVDITGPNARALGFNASPGPGQFDTTISLNTSITSPPNSPPSSYYGLQSVAAHELDEALGVGGPASTIPETGGSLTGPIGVEDLYRYSAPGVRSYSNFQTTSPYAYFSVDGGATVVSYFNQTDGADYADWLSNPIPTGFEPQVQDAFGDPGTDPALGPNELEALNVVGYTLSPGATTPEPLTLPLAGVGLGLGYILFRRKQTAV